MLRIKSNRDGFRRCGVAHNREAKEYPDDFFTPAQVKALRAEPMLAVEQVADREAAVEKKTVTAKKETKPAAEKKTETAKKDGQE